MNLLYPYFNYEFGANRIDVIPVTNGESTYWLMPLIVRMSTDNVPWSVGNPLYRLVGYALIDSYNGSIDIIIRGDDFFTEIFLQQYSDADNISREVPPWLVNQLRYPPELFIWRVQMYNFYHVTDVATFITAREFFEIPARLEPYYIFAKPPNINNIEYIGLLSLELRGAAGRNLAGYMVVRNDHPNDGEMIFYQVPIGSNIQLLGPTAVQQALERDPDFATLRTLLRNPRVGDNILYRVGDQDVYFIPIYTAGTEGVVAQLGKIAVVGAAFTGDYYVGLGDNPIQAFNAYLTKLAGLSMDQTELDRQSKISNIMGILEDKNLTIAKPTSINAPLVFKEKELNYITVDDLQAINGEIEAFISSRSRVIVWEEGDLINIGFIEVVDGVAELHYISIRLGL
jgi:hypothetical protein